MRRPGNADCALTFIPFMEQCVLPPDANGVLPPQPPPGNVDELGPFFALYNTCRGMNANAPAEVASLINDVGEMVDSSHCVIDTSSIISVRTEPPSSFSEWGCQTVLCRSMRSRIYLRTGLPTRGAQAGSSTTTSTARATRRSS